MYFELINDLEEKKTNYSDNPYRMLYIRPGILENSIYNPFPKTNVTFIRNKKEIQLLSYVKFYLISVKPFLNFILFWINTNVHER